jgi:hypothetical protein
MAFIVPPGGLAGFSQMTAASKARWMQGARGSGGGRRRKRKTKAKSTKRRKSGKRKLKFGSPAWRKKYNRKRK